MKVTGLYLVRNEVDLVELNLRHHLATVLDDAIAVDNGSTDGTLELLCELASELPLSVASEPGPYAQSELVTRMARQAVRAGADWVLPIDADEVWVASGGGFRAILEATPAGVGVLEARLTNFVQRRDQLAQDPAGLLTMTRRATPVEPRELCRERVTNGEIGFVEIVYPPKCVSRAAPGITVGVGNHTVDGVPGEVREEPRIECLHAPMRGRWILTTKIDQGRRAEEAGAQGNEFWHLRRWWNLARAGRIDEEWAANSHEDGALTVGGVRRPLVEDGRLRDAVAPHVRERELAAPHPIHALDPTVGAYLLALDTVPGWFSEIDFRTFAAVDAVQRANGLRGDLLEIGAYCGKSAILLGYLAGEDDRLLVCDLFNDNEATTSENRVENERWYPGFGRAQFEEQYLRFHTDLPDLFVGPSTDIDRDALAGRFRMVHVDGSHVHEIVREDIRTAERLLAPGGVVMLDDIATPHNPGSALGIWEAVVEGRLTPLCITNAKMYAVFDPGDVDWDARLDGWLASQRDIDVEHHTLAGHRVRRLVPGSRPTGSVPAAALVALDPLDAAAPAEPALTAPAAPAGRRSLRDVARLMTPPIAVSAYRRARERLSGANR